METISNGAATLRDPIEVLKELAEVYSSLPDNSVDKANIIADLGGKYRGGQLSALLGNWETYEKMMSDYQNSSGSAEAEAIKSANSIEGRLTALSNTWSRTVDNVVDSDILKAFVSIGTGATDLVDKMGLLQTALIALSIVGTYKAGTGLISWLTSATSSTLAFGNALNVVKGKDFEASTANLSKAIQGLSLSQASAVLSTQSLSNAHIEATLINAGFSNQEAKTTATTLTMASAQGIATGTTMTLGTAFKALGAAIASNPIGLIITGVTIAVSALSFGLNKYKQSQDDAMASAKDATSTYNEQSNSVDEYASKIKELRKEIDSGNLSTSDQTSKKQELLGIQTSLIDSYGLEKDSLDLVNGSIENQIGLLRTWTTEKANAYLNENRSSVAKATNEMTVDRQYKLSPILNSVTDEGQSIKEIAEQFSGKGIDLLQNGDDGSFTIYFKGNADQAYDTINEFETEVSKLQDEFKDSYILDDVLNISSEALNKSKKVLDDYQDMYKTALTAQLVTASPIGNGIDPSTTFYKYTEAVEKYNEALSSSTGIDEAKANYDDLYSKVESVLAIYPEFAPIFEDITNQTVKSTGTVEKTTDAIDKSTISLYSLAKSAEEATGYVNDLGKNVDISEIQSQIKNATTAVEDFKAILESMDENKGVSSDSLDTITQKYPQYLSYMGDEKELRKQLSQGILDQQKVAEGYYKEVIELDTNAYTTVLNNNVNKVNELNTYYNTDLSNFKSLANAKNEVETTLLISLNKKWSDFYKAQAGASAIKGLSGNTPISELIGGDALNSGLAKQLEADAKAKKLAAEKESAMYKQMEDLFVNTDYTGLALDNIATASGKSGTDKSKKEFSKVFDWLAIRIDKLKEKAQTAIDSIAKYTSYKTKNSKIEIAVKAKVDEKASLKIIQDSYNKMASKVGLSKEYRDLVDNGGLNIQTITDEKLATKIDEYQKWKDAADEVGKSIEGINDEIKDLNSLSLDNIKSYFDMKNSYTDSKVSKRESVISLREAQGKTGRTSDYDYLIKLQNDAIANIQAEYDATKVLFDQQVKDGIIKKGSPEYYEGLSYLNDLTIAANEADESLIDLSNRKVKVTFEKFDNKMEKSNKVISEIDQAVGFVDDNSIEQIALFQTGYAKATQNVKDLNAEISKLNKKYKGNTNDPIYKERLEDLESQLSSNASAMQSYQDSIVSSMKARYDKQLDLSDKALKEELKNIEKAKKAQLKALNDELDKYKEIIDARKKALTDKQEEDGHQDEIDEYTNDISKLESRIETLKSAEMSGDLTARAERRDAEDELAKQKKELTKLQTDYATDKAIDALDEEYDAYEKIKNKQISDVESFYDLQSEQAQLVYDNKALQLESLYENERQLIIEAAQLTQDKFTEAFSAINSSLGEYGLSASTDLMGASSSGSTYANSTAKSPSISSLLGKTSEDNKYSQDTSDLSGLNNYIASQGYKTISKKQMVELAKALGLADIDGVEDVQDTDAGRVNKNKIRDALKKAGFTNGGMTLTKDMVRSVGEDSMALVKDREIILNQLDSKTFKDFVPTMNNFMKQIKPNLPDFSNINNNSSAPQVIINLPASTTISKDAMSDYRKFIPEISVAVSNEIMKSSKLK